MNPVLTEILQSQSVTTPDGQRLPLHSHLPPLEGALLQRWLAHHRPARLLEIGMAYGVSTLFILDAVSWPLEHFHIIDPFQSGEWQGVGLENLSRAGFRARFRWHEQLSELCLPEFLRQGLRFDFAFVDGWHSFDQALVEFFYVNRMLDVGGIVVFDDVHLPSLQKILRYVDGYESYRRLKIPEETLRSVPMKVRSMMDLPPARIVGFEKLAQDQRNWDWFRDF